MKNPFFSEMSIERVGFTGSRFGMSNSQAESLRLLLREMWPFKEFHHGCCHGADYHAHQILRDAFPSVRRGGPEIHGWPPENEMRLSRKAVNSLDVTHTPREYKARDREIVYHTQVLIACPNSDTELLHSGTYYTMRQALAMNRPIFFIRPSDGVIVMDWKSEMNERAKARELNDGDMEAYLSGQHPERLVTDGDLFVAGRALPVIPALRVLNNRLAHEGLPEIELDESLPDDVLTLEVRPASDWESAFDVGPTDDYGDLDDAFR